MYIVLVKRKVLPPMSRVREPTGRSSEMLVRPVEPSGKAKVRLLTVMVGSAIGAVSGLFFRLFKGADVVENDNRVCASRQPGWYCSRSRIWISFDY